MFAEHTAGEHHSGREKGGYVRTYVADLTHCGKLFMSDPAEPYPSPPIAERWFHYAFEDVAEGGGASKGVRFANPTR